MDRARAGYRCAQGYRTPGYLWLLDRALGRQCGDLDHGAPDDWPGLCFFSPPARPPARALLSNTHAISSYSAAVVAMREPDLARTRIARGLHVHRRRGRS